MSKNKQVIVEASAGNAAQDKMQTDKEKSKWEDYQIPQKKKFGIANGKFKLPPDESFYDDEITEMFEDIKD